MAPASSSRHRLRGSQRGRTDRRRPGAGTFLGPPSLPVLVLRQTCRPSAQSVCRHREGQDPLPHRPEQASRQVALGQHGVAIYDSQPGKPDRHTDIERFHRSRHTGVLNAHLFESIAELRALPMIGSVPSSDGNPCTSIPDSSFSSTQSPSRVLVQWSVGRLAAEVAGPSCPARGVGARMRAGLRASNRRARHLPMRYETGLPSSVIRFRT